MSNVASCSGGRPGPDHRRWATTPIDLADGRSVTCRRARSADGDALLDLYAGLSDQSRYTRFCQATPTLTARLQQMLTDLDGGPVWLAWHRGRCVAEARLVGARDGAMHVALTVADDYQRCGLGRELTSQLVLDPDARRHHLVVTIMATNTSAARLARRAGFVLELADGMLEGRLPPLALQSLNPPSD